MKPCFLVIDKPAGITSHDVVAAVRAVTGIKKVGHTGTLDPFATGVLSLALGPATRLIQFLDESVKIYDATVVLGTRTDTADPTGEVVERAAVPALDEAGVEEMLRDFVGERDQVPPAYSAVKVDGRPLYRYAREGRPVEARARRVRIHDIELLELHPDRFRIRIACGRGTYARVLAEEMGAALGTVGHLGALSRTRSGPFFLDEAVTMEELAGWVAAEAGRPWEAVLLRRGRSEERVRWRPRAEVRQALAARTMPVIRALSQLPLADVDGARARKIRAGGAVPAPPAGVEVGGRYLVVCGADAVAVAEFTSRGPRPLRVLPG